MRTTGLQWERLSVGSPEQRGPVWSFRVVEQAVDPDTGEVIRRRRRERLGTVTQFRTRRAAELELERHRSALAPATLLPGRDVSAADYCEHFLAVRAAVKRRRTELAYQRIIRGVLKAACGDRRLADVDAAFVQGIIAKYSGNDCPADERRARTTLKLWRDVILRMLRQAARDGYSVHKIDARALELPSEKRVMQEPRWFERSEVDRILAAAGWPQKAIFAATYFAGLRIGEALGLRGTDVLHDARLVRVRQNVVDGRIGPPKTTGSRADIPLLPELAAILREYMDHHWRPNEHDLLFTTDKGAPLDSEFVRTRWLAPLLQELAGC